MSKDGRQFTDLVRKNKDTLISMKIKNIVRSKKPTATNPDRCWMNISFERMRIFMDVDYVFSCIIDGVEYIYCGCVRELFNTFKASGVDVMNNPDRYSFYLAECFLNFLNFLQ